MIGGRGKSRVLDYALLHAAWGKFEIEMAPIVHGRTNNLLGE